MYKLDEISNLIDTMTKPDASSPYPERLVKVLKDFGDVTNYMKTFPTNIGLDDANFADQILEKINELWNPLYKIAEDYKNPVTRERIEIAKQTLDQFISDDRRFFGSDPDILLRIENAGVARRYPYTGTFFISLPDVAILDPADSSQSVWQSSLAHELGHYIYWNSTFNTIDGSKFSKEDQEPLFTKDIDQKLQELDLTNLGKQKIQTTKDALSVTLSSWSEEIFADLIGVKLLGEKFATSSHDKAFDRIVSDKEGSYLEDTDHPIPYLRPFIAAEGLKIEENNPYRKLWESFKSKLSEALKNFNEAKLALTVGVITLDEPQKNPIVQVSIDIPLLQGALRLAIQCLSDGINTTEPLSGSTPSGLERFRMMLAEELLLSFPPVLEKGDWRGFLRRLRKRIRKIIKIR